jgi:hypothetical protein
VPQGREGDISRGSRPISRVLSRTVIHLGCASPHISSDLPGSRAGRTGQIDCPLRDLVLLQVGFTVPPMLPSARCALTAPFHPYSAPISCVCLSDTAIHKFLVLHVSAQRDERGAVSFLWHFPWAHAPQALPGALPWEPGLSSTLARSDCLADSGCDGAVESRAKQAKSGAGRENRGNSAPHHSRRPRSAMLRC